MTFGRRWNSINGLRTRKTWYYQIREEEQAMPITKAVFPVGGLGTRFLPATKAMPKEMLTVVDRPLIQYAIEECLAAGIDEFVFVTGRNKSALEDHFDSAYELEATLDVDGSSFPQILFGEFGLASPEGDIDKGGVFALFT